MSSFIVGLRGGIGTGKSAVSALFEGLGITIADADISARNVVEAGRPAYQAIVSHFGDQVLQADGTLDRAQLRKIVFSDVEARKFLESQTHKPIVDDLLATVNSATSPYAIMVLSTGLGKWPMMQRLLVVDAPKTLQLKRVMARDNNSQQQVEAILQAQPSRELRLQDADDVIVNDGDLSVLQLEVDKLHQLYLRLSEIEGKQHG